MTTYLVSGAMRKSGTDYQMRIDAADPEAAGETANNMGLLVTGVDPLEPDEGRGHDTITRKEWRKLASLIRTNVCVGILEALLILAIIGILILVFVGVRIGSLVS